MSPTKPVSIRPFTDSLPMGLLRARESTMRLFRPLLAEHSVTEQQWRVLRALSSAVEPLTVGQVAERTYLLGPSLSRIVANLDDRGLIQRSTGDDQRSSLLALTTDGEATVDAIGPHSEAVYNQIESAFGKRRLSQLLAELAELEELVSEVEDS